MLRQYIALVRAAARVAKEGNVPFGVDIPFWFDATNRFGEPAASLDGRPMSELVLDAVDNISIMDYRTVAYGPDGTLVHGADEPAYAARIGKPIYIGLETVFLPDETIQAFDAGTSGRRGTVTLLLHPAKNGKARVTLSRAGTPAPPSTRTLTCSYVARAPGSKLTFFEMPGHILDRVVRNTRRELFEYESFAGFAIHSYESYRPLRGLDRRPIRR